MKLSKYVNKKFLLCVEKKTTNPINIARKMENKICLNEMAIKVVERLQLINDTILIKVNS